MISRAPAVASSCVIGSTPAAGWPHPPRRLRIASPHLHEPIARRAAGRAMSACLCTPARTDPSSRTVSCPAAVARRPVLRCGDRRLPRRRAKHFGLRAGRCPPAATRRLGSEAFRPAWPDSIIITAGIAPRTAAAYAGRFTAAAGGITSQKRGPRRLDILPAGGSISRNAEALRGVAQLGLERLVRDQEVAGSNPVTPIFRFAKNKRE